MKKAIIIGAGPAGLTAAYELLKRTDIIPIIIEKSNDIGGLSKTVDYKGNKIDIGGHRFFSKSDRVMEWWQNIMPIDNIADQPLKLSYQNSETWIQNAKNEIKNPDLVLLVRNRISRIFHRGNFFSYPIKLNFDTLSKLGIIVCIKIITSFFYAKLFIHKKPINLEDFFISRFGKSLYQTFFKDYTEKVWGVPCNKISAQWGQQRIKELSVLKVFSHALKKIFSPNNKSEIAQKNIETSLLENFLYPKYGPGQMWEEVARQIIEMGGEIHKNNTVDKIHVNQNDIISIETTNIENGSSLKFVGDYFFSTMPIKDLIPALNTETPNEILSIANGLEYRDFITVGLLLKKLAIQEKGIDVKDNWIYIQDSGVKIGRLQLFHNWSPHLLANQNNFWLGLEYFCNKGDDLWKMDDKEFIEFAIDELQSIKIIDKSDLLDATILRSEKTYPAYFGTYHKFGALQQYLDKFENLFLIGRNGMHKYNNTDHSMLTAMTAVDNIIQNVKDKSNIWNINPENEYIETKKTV